MSALTVEVVAVDRSVWSGQTRSLNAMTVDGAMGILPGHVPVLALLAAGNITVEPLTGDSLVIGVDSGFFSVDNDRVVVVAENAHLRQAQAASPGSL